MIILSVLASSSQDAISLHQCMEMSGFLGPVIHHEDDPLFGSSALPVLEEDVCCLWSNNSNLYEAVGRVVDTLQEMHEDDPIFPLSPALIHHADNQLFGIIQVDYQDTAFVDTLVVDDSGPSCVADTFQFDDQDTCMVDDQDAVDTLMDGFVIVDQDVTDDLVPYEIVCNATNTTVEDAMVDEEVIDVSHDDIISGDGPMAAQPDLEMEGGVAPAHHISCIFNLDRWLEDSLRVPVSSPTHSMAIDTFDSQLTQNENPSVSSQPAELTPPPSHFTQQPQFWDKVHERVHGYLGQPWLGEASSLDRLTPDFNMNADVCAQAIQEITSIAINFKIGITCDPHWRFFYCSKGHYAQRFDKMVLVYVADTSKPKKIGSTGMMEKEQIKRFGHLPGCENVGKGGERPSDVIPHFMYIVYR